MWYNTHDLKETEVICLKSSNRVRAFIGDLLDGISCRFATVSKFVKKHPKPVLIGASSLAALIVLLCIFVPIIKRAAQDNPGKEASTVPTDYIMIPTAIPTATPKATPVPTASPDPTPTPVPLHLVKGDRNDIVYDIQRRLMELNYMDFDEPTNYLGSATMAAIKSFQRRNNLEITGEIQEADYSLLMSNSAKLYMASLGDEGEDITEMQKRLHELDFLDRVNGVFDEKTESAVKLFQEKNALTVDGMVGTQTKECLYSEDAIPFALSYGSSGPDVKKYQDRLYELGYLSTKPDGVYGTDTVKAVKRFQERNDIIVDGHVGPSTKTALMSPNCKYNKLEITMSGDDVERVQQRLYKLNYLKRSEVTGYFGEITEKAVRVFQKNNKLTVDGTVGKHTLQVLFSDDAIRASKPVSSTPKPTATPKPGTTPKPTPKPSSGTGGGSGGSGSSTQDKINNLIKIARSKLGCPYVRGAKGPNAFDCSGFVYWCLNKAGVQQSYMTSYMWRTTTRYPRIYSMSNIKAGDVIVYKMGAYQGHVAIAVGNGMMIDASSSEGKVVYRTYQTSYWRSVFYCGYRIFGNK